MTLPRFSFQSLKTRLTLAVLAVFVASLWGTLLFIRQTLGTDLRVLLEAQQFSTASIVADHIDQALNTRLHALELVANGAGAAVLAGPAAIQSLVEQRPVLAAYFNGGFTVVNAQGTVIADYPLSAGRKGVNYMDRPYVVNALKEGKASIGVAVIGKALSKPVLPLAVPIRDTQGRVIGALTGIVNLGLPNFFDELTATGYAKTGGYVLVNPLMRQIVTATDKSRALEVLPAPGVNPVIDRALNGFEGSTVFTNPVGVEVLGSFKKIPSVGWYLAVALPTQEAFAPLRGLERRMLFLGLLLTLAVAGMARWVIHRQLAPMSAAAQALASMTGEQLKLQHLRVVRPDEVGQLVAGFNESLRRVNESNALYRAVLDAAPVPMALNDAQQNVIYLNPAFVATFGYTLSDIPTLGDWWPLAYPDPTYRQWVADTWQARARQSQQTGAPFEPMELMVRCLTGQARRVLASASAVIDTAHKVYLVVLEDITERKRIESDMRTSNDLLEYSQAATKVGGWELTVATGALYWTAETYRIHETTPAEFNPTVDAGVSYFLPESRLTIATALQAAMAHGQGYDLELETYTTKGRLISVRTTCTVTMHNGKPVKLTGIFQDITASKQALKVRETLDRQLKLLEKAVANLNDIVLITEAEPVDEPGPRIVFVNDAFVRRTGYTREEVIGKTPRLLQGPKTQRAELDRVGAALRKWEPVRAELINYTKSGEEFWLELDIAPVADDTGWFTHWVAVERDITERKAAQQLLRESEGRLAGVIESAMDAIISVNPEQHIVLFNAAAEKMFGTSAIEVMGQSLDRLIPQGLRARHKSHINNFFGTGGSTRPMGDHTPLMALRANGEEFPIEASISRVQVAGQLLFTAIVRDVTDSTRARLALESANRELARSNAELAQFAFVASHDLQEPLRSISSCVQLLQMRYQGQIDARADEFIAHAVGGSQRMQMVIDDLLAYARISAAPQVMRVIDLNAALQVAQENLSGAIADSHALISHDELPPLTANPIQIAQLFQNLLGNALKFRGGKAGRVHVGARLNGAEWIISVADQGIGIAPEHFERIFGLFKRLHGRNEYPGTGIGLTICQKIVERHGGRMWVESVVGQGSTFFFTLGALG